MQVNVTKGDIAAGLSRLQVKKGDILLVHSSLSSFGHVIGGADTVVDALLAAVGPTGTVVVPTFTHDHSILFDPKKTPSASGAIPNAFWRRAEALRSLHTTHAYAAIGPKAAWLTSNHETASTFGLDSPLGKLISTGGDVVLIGVGLNRATAMHFGETLAKATCLGEGTVADKCLDPASGQVIPVWTASFRSRRCPVGDPAEVERRLKQSDVWHETRIGNARVIKTSGAAIAEGFRDLLLEGWNGHPGCQACSVTPHRL